MCFFCVPLGTVNRISRGSARHGSLSSDVARPGFLLVEALVGIGVFAIFLAGVGMTLLYGQENTIMAGDRTRATNVSLRALEAVRGIRDASFASLTAGTKGVAVGGGGAWGFVATPQTVTGSFVSSVTLTASGADWMKVDALTKWKRGYARSGSVLVSAELANWRTTTALGDWRSPAVDGTYSPGGSVLFGRSALKGSTLFVTAGDSVGLYVLNVSNPASPARLASSFSVGAAAYDVAVRGNRLYVVTADSNAELKVYDVTTPSSPTAVTTVNIQGSGRGRSLAITDRVLLLGATQSGLGTENELYSFDISGTGSSIPVIDTKDDTGDLLALATSGTGVYAASTDDSAELRAFLISSTGTLALSAAPAYSLSADAQSIFVTGTSALVGTLRGAIQEMVLFNVRPTTPALSSPGPWYHEGSGSVVGTAMDPSRCVGFLAADTGHKAFQVVHVRDTSLLSELATYDSSSGKGRAVLYDPVRDRVYLSTDQSLVVFRPGTSTGSCP